MKLPSSSPFSSHVTHSLGQADSHARLARAGFSWSTARLAQMACIQLEIVGLPRFVSRSDPLMLSSITHPTARRERPPIWRPILFLLPGGMKGRDSGLTPSVSLLRGQKGKEEGMGEERRKARVSLCPKLQPATPSLLSLLFSPQTSLFFSSLSFLSPRVPFSSSKNSKKREGR